ncbi:uncharacterized protein LOC114579344 [Dendrobium catenatum]|uniref:uncharacterized protein LOC114579344 n=1 Tax=Dendrobium catenatum TaxID=906689 RepID=UPI0010A01FCF|nr:uncharacterized protein LOC114579344 [Dendrobium catenatum]
MVTDVILAENPLANKLYWKWIKKIKLIPRIENFWWRIYHGAVPTFEFLLKRRLTYTDIYPRGCIETENINHLIAACPKLRNIIHIINEWGFNIPAFQSLQDRCSWMEGNVGIKLLVAKIYCNIVYLNWKSRGKYVYDGKEDSNSFIAAQAIALASFARRVYPHSGNWGANQPHMLFLNNWHPPPPGWPKLNVDVSLYQSYEATVRRVFKDCKGGFLMAFGFKGLHWDISWLELLAIQALKIILQEWMLDFEGKPSTGPKD